MAFSACFVTPSYARDFERCQLLVESRRVCAPEIEHFIIVDRPDLELFGKLAGDGTHILDSRALLSSALHKMPGRNGWWWSFRTPPLRGWITQQLRKLAMADFVDHDVLINLDSDVVFVRPFDRNIFFRGEDLSLFEVDYRNDEIRDWSCRAARLIGIAPPGEPFNYVGMLIPWWRARVRELTAAMEGSSGLPWQIALGREKSISEYMAYGTYIRHAVGLAGARHFSDSRMLVQTSWHKDTGSEDGLADLFAAPADETVGVMVHSKDGVTPSRYAHHARALWDRARHG